jgi:DNA (cytosine-5)-methyltransferase 1
MNEKPYVTDTGNTRGGTREEGRNRYADEPAPLITSRADQLEKRGCPPSSLRGDTERPETTSPLRALDLFAGPGGWDVGAEALGIEPLGIEYDDAAVATREAYGLSTIHADVTTLDPLEVARAHSEEAAADGIDLLIASPPCQAWSMAGSRKGIDDLDRVYALTRAVAGRPTGQARSGGPSINEVKRSLSATSYTLRANASGSTPGGVEWISEEPTEWEDERSKLVVEPLRWALALRPGLLAFEQVPPVLDYWRFIGSILRDEGYAVWTGILSAERYGVPQTRKRAILMASKIGGVHPPLPTHLPYVAGEPKPTEPMLTLEGELKPWVSMAEALGWAEGSIPAPSPTITTGGGEKGGVDVFAGAGSRARARAAITHVDPNAGRGEGMKDRHGERAASPVENPAPTVSCHAADWKLRAGTNENDVTREGEEPAPTLRFGERLNAVEWVDGSPRYLDTRQSHAQARSTNNPAPTMVGANLAKGSAVFTDDPATEPTEGTAYKPTRGVRVTIEEASILQSFPPDYPWQGSRTKQFQQIGNAVPPLMAKAILEALIA